VLARLLALNAERYEEEVNLGLHSKGAKQAAKASRGAGASGAAGGILILETDESSKHLLIDKWLHFLNEVTTIGISRINKMLKASPPCQFNRGPI